MAPFQLLHLPDELIVSIVEHVTSVSDLRTLACTSRRLQAIAEPQLYRKIFIRTERQATNLIGAFRNATWRKNSVAYFEARCKTKQFSNVKLCGDIVRTLPNLQEYVLESPYCNKARWLEDDCRRTWSLHHAQLMRDLQDASTLPQNNVELSQRPLQSLRKCNFPRLENTVDCELTITLVILHLNGVDGNEFWTMKSLECCLFAHPTLQELKISSANLFDDTRQFIPDVRDTPLRSLCLEECNITADALAGMLSHPAALKHLYVGEALNCQDMLEVIPHSTIRDKDTFFSAIGMHKESLESFCFVTRNDPDWLIAPDMPLIPDRYALADFEELKTLDLTCSCTHLEQVLALPRTAPPNLETLFLRGFWYEKTKVSLGSWSPARPDDLDSQVQNILLSLPKLKNLYVILSAQFRRSSPEGKARMEKMSRGWVSRLRDRNCRLQVHVEPPHKEVVPPLLFGEIPTPDDLVFDSETGVFSGNGVPYDSWQTSSDEDNDMDDDTDDEDWDDEEDEQDDDPNDADDDGDAELDDGFGDIDADLGLVYESDDDQPVIRT